MNFLERIEKNILDYSRIGQHRNPGTIRVDAHALIQLVEEYKKLDSSMRIKHIQGNPSVDPMQVLHTTLNTLFRKDPNNVDSTLVEILSIVHDLSSETIKYRKTIDLIKSY